MLAHFFIALTYSITKVEKMLKLEFAHIYVYVCKVLFKVFLNQVKSVHTAHLQHCTHAISRIRIP